jgi:catechol 2,3-dioxygenase-like lactoylglutathione lyase family enzyme
MYRDGLGLVELGRFENHEGFDGIMLGRRGWDCHLEFSFCLSHPVKPAPTPEDLLVFYLPDRGEWEGRCRSMRDAGFVEIAPFNPYWGLRGRTFEDHDGYRVVLQQDAWDPGLEE